jgi:hypothetical protein
MSGQNNSSEEYSIWISPSTVGSGTSGSPYMVSGVYSVSTLDTEGPVDAGSAVFIAEEVVGVGDKGSVPQQLM